MTNSLGDGAVVDGADTPSALPLAPARASDAGRRNLDQRRILSSIGEAVYEWDCYSDALVWGAGAEGALGVSPGALASTGAAWLAQLGPERAPPWLSGRAREAASGRYHIRYPLDARSTIPSDVWIDDHGRWFPGADGRPARAHGSVRISLTEASKRGASDFASHASEARVLSRAEFEDRAGLLMHEARNGSGSFACVLIAPALVVEADAARAREAADEIMAGMAARVRSHMRDPDVLTRFGEDALGLLLEGCSAEQARVAIARFADAVMSAPIDTSAGPVPLRTQAGACVCATGADLDALFETALEALAQARAESRRSPCVVREFRPLPLVNGAVRRISDQVAEALHENRVQIALQPIVSAATGEPASCEALARIKGRSGETLGPGEFLPAIEETGLVAALDAHMLELTLRVLEAEPARRIAVNVSGATLHDPRWLERVEAALEGRMRCAERLTFEITETIALHDLARTGRDIARLHTLGCRIAIDDFGAGHTSFRNLRALDVDVLKIDGVFVKNMLQSPDDQMFVRTLQGLAQHLGMRTVAEWVECAESARLLASWGVDYLQGRHFGSAEIWTPAGAARVRRSAA
ncbi:MAG: GGDEF-domain containing protein [Hyphomicrobiales bacterium]|nr:GGDEF-domain containing protein [Hyphomicrobiales bacterium]